MIHYCHYSHLGNPLEQEFCQFTCGRCVFYAMGAGRSQPLMGRQICVADGMFFH
jgi:hypothetical protein